MAKTIATPEENENSYPMFFFSFRRLDEMTRFYSLYSCNTNSSTHSFAFFLHGHRPEADGRDLESAVRCEEVVLHVEPLLLQVLPVLTIHQWLQPARGKKWISQCCSRDSINSQCESVSNQRKECNPRYREASLPPAYVVRREGNSFTLLVCPHLGRVSQLTQPGGGSASWGGGSVSRSRGGSASRGVGCHGGGLGQSGGQGGGSAKIGQQNEYSLHGGRYASCVHAGGLSCIENEFEERSCFW